MRIVILDGYTLNPGDNPWEPVQRLGELTVNDYTPDNQILSQAADHEIVITNKAPISAETIEKLPRLKFIAVTATGDSSRPFSSPDGLMRQGRPRTRPSQG